MEAEALELSPLAMSYLPNEGEVVAAATPLQAELIADTTTRKLGVVGGLGSSKSRALVYKALQLGTLNPGCPGLYVLPSYAAVEQAGVEEFLTVFAEWGMEEGADFTLRRRAPQKLNVYLNDVEFEVWFRSSDNPRALTAYNVAWAVIDEAGDHTEAAALQVMARCRLGRARCIQVVIGGTPEVLGGWFYEWFKGNPGESTRLIRASTTSNHLLYGGAEEWIRLNLGHLSEQDRKRYVEGLWIVPGGRVYTNYDPDIHQQKCLDPGVGQQVMSCDFGRGCMAWLFARVQGGRHAHYHGEQVLEGVGIHQARDRALDWWQAFFLHERGEELTRREAAERVIVYCDPAGRNNGPEVSILEEAGFTVLCHSRHPAVMDRVYSLEQKLYVRELLIDPDGCPMLCRSLQQQSFGRDGKPKKARGREGIRGLDHTNDALGYHVEYEWRAAAPKGNSRRYF